MAAKILRISVVVPVYNEARHLTACLESLATQTHLPDEVIVVDNNSTDGSMRLARRYPFVKIVREPRQGVIFARNRGFDASKGDIIGRIDADTVLPRDWVEKLLAFYSEEAHAGQAWTGGPDFYNVRFRRLVNFGYSMMGIRSNKLFAGTYSLWGSNMAVRREQWQAVAREVCQRPRIHEDLDLAIHLHKAGVGVFYDASTKVRAQLRRVHSDQDKLWDYLQWWPQTLRVHRLWSWPLCWFTGAFMLFYLAKALSFTERQLRSFEHFSAESTTERI